MTKLLFITDKVIAKTETGKKEALTSTDYLIILSNVLKLKNYVKPNYKIVLIGTTTNAMLKVKYNLLNNITKELESILDLESGSIDTIINSCENEYTTLPKPGNIYDYLLDQEVVLKDSYLIGTEECVPIKNMSGINSFILL
jgi:hypothetical protein